MHIMSFSERPYFHVREDDIIANQNSYFGLANMGDTGFDPAKGHQLYHEYFDERVYAGQRVAAADPPEERLGGRAHAGRVGAEAPVEGARGRGVGDLARPHGVAGFRYDLREVDPRRCDLQLVELERREGQVDLGPDAQWQRASS